jgi:hypothetical protein
MKKITPLISLLFIFSCSESVTNIGVSDTETEVSVIKEPFIGDFINDTIFEIDPSI